MINNIKKVGFVFILVIFAAGIMALSLEPVVGAKLIDKGHKTVGHDSIKWNVVETSYHGTAIYKIEAITKTRKQKAEHHRIYIYLSGYSVTAHAYGNPSKFVSGHCLFTNHNYRNGWINNMLVTKYKTLRTYYMRAVRPNFLRWAYPSTDGELVDMQFQCYPGFLYDLKYN